MGLARLDADRGAFDKWQMYRFLRGKQIGPCSVPHTRPLTEKGLINFLDRFRRVYVKPTSTWGGSNIVLVTRDESSIKWTSQTTPPRSVEISSVLEHYHSVPAIVQEAIPALTYHGCPFDIRVHMQRDIDDKWIYAGELVRVGGAGIVSNVAISHGKVLPLSVVISQVSPMNDAGFEDFKNHLCEIGYQICKLFDPYPQIDEVGIDLALDSSQHLWLIEVNTNDSLGGPSHELFRQLPTQDVYQAIQHRANARKVNMIQTFLSFFAEVPDETS
jgi:YheC/D like ATP-grasp